MDAGHIINILYHATALIDNHFHDEQQGLLLGGYVVAPFVFAIVASIVVTASFYYILILTMMTTMSAMYSFYNDYNNYNNNNNSNDRDYITN